MIIKGLFKAIWGGILIIIGIIGLLTPIMPGWIFIILGLLIFSPSSKKKFKKWLKARKK